MRGSNAAPRACERRPEGANDRAGRAPRGYTRARAGRRLPRLDGYQAGKRGLEGWARNRRDGSVEAVFAGEPRAVGAMLEACRDGPPGAWVDKVEHAEAAAEQLALRQAGELFSLLPTV